MVKVTVNDDKILETSDYSAEFVRRAKMINGRWDSSKKAWVFDVSNEGYVRNLLLDIYGTDGTPTETCTVQVALDHDLRISQKIELFGRVLADRPNRDAAVLTHPSVSIVAGGDYPRFGGSAKHPAINFAEGTILEVADVPLQIALKIAAEDERVTIVTVADKLRASLLEEREKLLKRLAEIDAQLG